MARNILWVTGIVLLCACAPAPFTSSMDGPVSDWPAYGSSPGGGHYSTLTQITPENVHALELAWVHRSGDFRQAIIPEDRAQEFRTQTSFQVTPIVVDDTLYYCSPFNRVFALDPTSGKERWVFDPEVDTDPIVLTNCRGVSSWKADNEEGICKHRIFTATLDGRLFSLDANTGIPCKDFGNQGYVNLRDGLGQHNGYEYAVTSPPAILGDLVITGALVLDNRRVDGPGGVVRAFDARSGELVWYWDPIPPGSKPVLTDTQQRYQKGTTNVWSIISIDPERNLVFVPTGNTTPDYYGGHRGGENDMNKGLDYYSSSVVALDGSTGKVVWNFQAVHHDIWDFDTPSQPSLYDVTINGESIPALAQPTKMGHLFLLNRETGEPIWPVEERAVPQNPAPGEYLSPTQPFPTRPTTLNPEIISPETAWGLTPWDKGKCADIIETARWEGIFTPPSLQGSISYPFQGGGNNWGSPAIDHKRNIIILKTSHIPALMTLYPREQCADIPGAHPQEGAPYCVTPDILVSPIGIPCNKPPWNTLNAIDLNTGEHLWKVPLGTTRDMAPFPFWWIKGTPGTGGPTVSASGLTFITGAGDHFLRAFNTETGKELWKGRLPTAAPATPMTYRLEKDGRQFVVIAAGGHWGGGAESADHLMAFALPDQ